MITQTDIVFYCCLLSCIYLDSLCSTQEQLLSALTFPALQAFHSYSTVYWGTEVFIMMFYIVCSFALELYPLHIDSWAKWDSISPENLSWLEGYLSLYNSICLVSLIRAWNRRASGIPTIFPAATCWTSSAEWGGTCSTPASAVSEGRTQVSHCATLFPKPTVEFSRKRALLFR